MKKNKKLDQYTIVDRQWRNLDNLHLLFKNVDLNTSYSGPLTTSIDKITEIKLVVNFILNFYK